jgi:hypothetical protein
MNKRRYVIAFALALGAFFPAARAQAQNGTEQAKALFLAGAAAYEHKDYLGAIRAFEGAQQLAPRPANLFSLAQAHRRQYAIDSIPTHRSSAIDLFREYVKQVPKGTARYDDAQRALEELGAAPQAQQEVASVSINSSGTPHAHVSLDGAPAVDAPLIGTTTPGKHHAIISADGYANEERDVIAVTGQIVAVDVPLREKPARLVINAPSGAVIVIDGRPAGETPLAAPLAIGAGAHVVAISKNGHEGYVSELDLARGEDRKIDAPLPATKQRSIALALLVTSGVAVIGGATCAALAKVYLDQANGIVARGATVQLTLDDYNAYRFAVDTRGAMLIATAASFASAIVFAGTGLALYVFDKPSTTAHTAEHTDKPTDHKTPTDLTITPVASWNTVGVSALLRF